MVDICLLGCGGGMPMPFRSLSSTILNFKGRKILIDCGEGTQVSMKIAGTGFKDIDLKDYFIEFEDYDDCKFGSRCIHQNEPNCAVKEAVENGEIPKERYESYIQLLNEIRQGKRRY